MKDAVEDDYFFEMYVDDLPMWAYVGEVVHEEFLLGKSIQGSKVYIYPHLAFSIGYNKDQIVAVNVTTDPSRRVDVTDDKSGGQEIIFSYSVEWVHQPHISYKHRLQRYHDHNSPFVPETFEIHWLSIINSIVLVFLLTAFLAIVLLRILKNDFSKYLNVDEVCLVSYLNIVLYLLCIGTYMHMCMFQEDLTEDESGWKMVHGDVFRAPAFSNILVALVGAGAQVFGTAFVILLCVLMGVFKATKRGALLTAAIVVFSCCGFLGGLVCGRLYKQLKGKDWAWNVILTASVIPVPLATVFTFVNGVAVSNNSTAALPTLVILVSCM